MEVINVSRISVPDVKSKTYHLGLPRSLKEATTIDPLDTSTYVSKEEVLMLLSVGNRQLLRYRSIAVSYISNYMTVAKKRNTGYVRRIKGSKLPRIDAPTPGWTHYEVWVLKGIQKLVQSLRSREQVEKYLEENHSQYSALYYANIQNFPISEEDEEQFDV